MTGNTRNFGKHEYYKKQEQTLQAFHKNYFETEGADVKVGTNLAMVLLLGIVGIMFMIPYQGMQELKTSSLWSFSCVLGFFLYMAPYTQYREKGIAKSLYGKLKYVPISKEILLKYRFKKLLCFASKVGGVFLILQLASAAIFVREITLANVWYPVVFGFLLPFAITCGYILAVDK